MVEQSAHWLGLRGNHETDPPFEWNLHLSILALLKLRPQN